MLYQSRMLIFALLLCLFQSTAWADSPAKDLDIYILIGQSNMAGRAKVPEDATGEIERCFLLNNENKWGPAKNPLNLYSTIRKGEGMQKLNPGYSFAKAMLAHDKKAKIGLVVNARGGSKIEQWIGKDANYYKQLLARTRAAMKTGTVKGILWHQGESNSNNPEKYAEQLKTLITNLREDLGNDKLPFVAGQIRFDLNLEINNVIAALPENVPNAGVASSKGLKTYDKWHFDTEGQLELGKRYAEQMIKLQKKSSTD